MTVYHFPPSGKTDWLSRCQISENKTPIPNLYNAALALREAPELLGLLAYDEMACTPILRLAAPGIEADPQSPRRYPSPVTDNDVTAIQEFIQKSGIRRMPKDTTHQAVDLIASEHSFHPVREYLKSLVWDGERRLQGWLNAYLGVEHNDYSSRIGIMFMVAMVARIFEPGCQADYMLVLEGDQGIGKSSACHILADEWFSDNLPDLAKADPVRLAMHLRGKWLIEIAELSSFSTAETSTLKEFITTAEERYIPKYGRREVYEPRQCLFIGTTNQSVYLKDETGARRFWPLKCGIISLQALANDRKQLFAEAVHLHHAGYPRFPDKEFEEKFIRPEQEKRFEADIWQELIQIFVLGRREVTTMEVAKNALLMAKSAAHSGINRRISSILRKLGFEGQHTKKGTIWIRR